MGFDWFKWKGQRAGLAPSIRNERGVGLVTAIVVISALAMLGTVMMQLIVNERAAATRSVSSVRALLAAKTAQQWGLYQTFTNASPACSDQKYGNIFDKDEIEGKIDSGKLVYLNQCFNGTKAEWGTGNLNSSCTITVEGACYEGTSSEARRRLEVRFYDPS